jgi:linearmycin/streptolysin S transport system permease protein
MNITAFRALVRKDLVLYFSSRRALIMSIAAPIVIAAFFGSLFGNDDGKPSRIPVAYTDLDGSALTRQIATSMAADPALDVRLLGEGEAGAAVRAGKVRAAIVMPKGFGEATPEALVRGGAKPVVHVQYDPSQAAGMAIVRGVFAQHVMESIGRAAGMGGSGASASASGPEAGSGGGFSLPFRTEATAAVAAGGGAPVKYNGYAHSFAGMSVQFILFMGIDIGIGVLLARRLGLWKRLRAAPLGRATLLGSTIVSGALIALVILAIVYAAAMAFFGVRIEGSVPGFIGIAVAFGLLTSSFGLLIAALGKTPEATRGLAIFVTLVMVMLGGAWVPSFLFPAWLQTASLAVPTRWAVDGFDAMTWRGLGLDAAAAPIGVMLAFAAAFAALAIWRFDWDEPRG